MVKFGELFNDDPIFDTVNDVKDETSDVKNLTPFIEKEQWVAEYDPISPEAKSVLDYHSQLNDIQRVMYMQSMQMSLEAQRLALEKMYLETGQIHRQIDPSVAQNLKVGDYFPDPDNPTAYKITKIDAKGNVTMVRDYNVLSVGNFSPEQKQLNEAFEQEAVNKALSQNDFTMANYIASYSIGHRDRDPLSAYSFIKSEIADKLFKSAGEKMYKNVESIAKNIDILKKTGKVSPDVIEKYEREMRQMEATAKQLQSEEFLQALSTDMTGTLYDRYVNYRKTELANDATTIGFQKAYSENRVVNMSKFIEAKKTLLNNLKDEYYTGIANTLKTKNIETNKEDIDKITNQVYLKGSTYIDDVLKNGTEKDKAILQYLQSVNHFNYLDILEKQAEAKAITQSFDKISDYTGISGINKARPYVAVSPTTEIGYLISPEVSYKKYQKIFGESMFNRMQGVKELDLFGLQNKTESISKDIAKGLYNGMLTIAQLSLFSTVGAVISATGNGGLAGTWNFVDKFKMLGSERAESAIVDIERTGDDSWTGIFNRSAWDINAHNVLFNLSHEIPVTIATAGIGNLFASGLSYGAKQVARYSAIKATSSIATKTSETLMALATRGVKLPFRWGGKLTLPYVVASGLPDGAQTYVDGVMNDVNPFVNLLTSSLVTVATGVLEEVVDFDGTNLLRKINVGGKSSKNLLEQVFAQAGIEKFQKEIDGFKALKGYTKENYFEMPVEKEGTVVNKTFRLDNTAVITTVPVEKINDKFGQLTGSKIASRIDATPDNGIIYAENGFVYRKVVKDGKTQVERSTLTEVSDNGLTETEMLSIANSTTNEIKRGMFKKMVSNKAVKTPINFVLGSGLEGATEVIQDLTNKGIMSMGNALDYAIFKGEDYFIQREKDKETARQKIAKGEALTEKEKDAYFLKGKYDAKIDASEIGQAFFLGATMGGIFNISAKVLTKSPEKRFIEREKQYKQELAERYGLDLNKPEDAEKLEKLYANTFNLSRIVHIGLQEEYLYELNKLRKSGAVSQNYYNEQKNFIRKYEIASALYGDTFDKVMNVLTKKEIEEVKNSVSPDIAKAIIIQNLLRKEKLLFQKGKYDKILNLVKEDQVYDKEGSKADILSKKAKELAEEIKGRTKEDVIADIEGIKQVYIQTVNNLLETAGQLSIEVKGRAREALEQSIRELNDVLGVNVAQKTLQIIEPLTTPSVAQPVLDNANLNVAFSNRGALSNTVASTIENLASQVKKQEIAKTPDFPPLLSVVAWVNAFSDQDEKKRKQAYNGFVGSAGLARNLQAQDMDFNPELALSLESLFGDIDQPDTSVQPAPITEPHIGFKRREVRTNELSMAYHSPVQLYYALAKEALKQEYIKKTKDVLKKAKGKPVTKVQDTLKQLLIEYKNKLIEANSVAYQYYPQVASDAEEVANMYETIDETELANAMLSPIDRDGHISDNFVNFHGDYTLYQILELLDAGTIDIVQPVTNLLDLFNKARQAEIQFNKTNNGKGIDTLAKMAKDIRVFFGLHGINHSIQTLLDLKADTIENTIPTSANGVYVDEVNKNIEAINLYILELQKYNHALQNKLKELNSIATMYNNIEAEYNTLKANNIIPASAQQEIEKFFKVTKKAIDRARNNITQEIQASYNILPIPLLDKTQKTDDIRVEFIKLQNQLARTDRKKKAKASLTNNADRTFLARTHETNNTAINKGSFNIRYKAKSRPKIRKSLKQLLKQTQQLPASDEAINKAYQLFEDNTDKDSSMDIEQTEILLDALRDYLNDANQKTVLYHYNTAVDISNDPDNPEIVTLMGLYKELQVAPDEQTKEEIRAKMRTAMQIIKQEYNIAKILANKAKQVFTQKQQRQTQTQPQFQPAGTYTRPVSSTQTQTTTTQAPTPPPQTPSAPKRPKTQKGKTTQAPNQQDLSKNTFGSFPLSIRTEPLLESDLTADRDARTLTQPSDPQQTISQILAYLEMQADDMVAKHIEPALILREISNMVYAYLEQLNKSLFIPINDPQLVQQNQASLFAYAQDLVSATFVRKLAELLTKKKTNGDPLIVDEKAIRETLDELKNEINTLIEQNANAHQNQLFRVIAEFLQSKLKNNGQSIEEMLGEIADTQKKIDKAMSDYKQQIDKIEQRTVDTVNEIVEDFKKNIEPLRQKRDTIQRQIDLLDQYLNQNNYEKMIEIDRAISASKIDELVTIGKKYRISPALKALVKDSVVVGLNKFIEFYYKQKMFPLIVDKLKTAVNIGETDDMLAKAQKAGTTPTEDNIEAFSFFVYLGQNSLFINDTIRKAISERKKQYQKEVITTMLEAFRLIKEQTSAQMISNNEFGISVIDDFILILQDINTGKTPLTDTSFTRVIKDTLNLLNINVFDRGVEMPLLQIPSLPASQVFKGQNDQFNLLSTLPFFDRTSLQSLLQTVLDTTQEIAEVENNKQVLYDLFMLGIKNPNANTNPLIKEISATFSKLAQSLDPAFAKIANLTVTTQKGIQPVIDADAVPEQTRKYKSGIYQQIGTDVFNAFRNLMNDNSETVTSRFKSLRLLKEIGKLEHNPDANPVLDFANVLDLISNMGLEGFIKEELLESADIVNLRNIIKLIDQYSIIAQVNDSPDIKKEFDSLSDLLKSIERKAMNIAMQKYNKSILELPDFTRHALHVANAFPVYFAELEYELENYFEVTKTEDGDEIYKLVPDKFEKISTILEKALELDGYSKAELEYLNSTNTMFPYTYAQRINGMLYAYSLKNKTSMMAFGEGGTGKTTSIKLGVEAFARMNNHTVQNPLKVLFIAPTSSVLENQSLGVFSDKVQLDKFDISVLDDITDDKSIEEALTYVLQQQKYSAIVIDEYTLLKENQIGGLIKQLDKTGLGILNIPLIAVGDLGQMKKEAGTEGSISAPFKHKHIRPLSISFRNFNFGITKAIDAVSFSYITEYNPDPQTGRVEPLVRASTEFNDTKEVLTSLAQNLYYFNNEETPEGARVITSEKDAFIKEVLTQKDNYVVLVATQADKEELIEKGVPETVIYTIQNFQGLSESNVFVYTKSFETQDVLLLQKQLYTATTRAKQSVTYSGDVFNAVLGAEPQTTYLASSPYTNSTATQWANQQLLENIIDEFAQKGIPLPTQASNFSTPNVITIPDTIMQKTKTDTQPDTQTTTATTQNIPTTTANTQQTTTTNTQQTTTAGTQQTTTTQQTNTASNLTATLNNLTNTTDTSIPNNAVRNAQQQIIMNNPVVNASPTNNQCNTII